MFKCFSKSKVQVGAVNVPDVSCITPLKPVYFEGDVDVEDLHVKFKLRNGSEKDKLLTSEAYYYPDGSSRDDGVCFRNADRKLVDFMREWRELEYAVFDDAVAPFDEFAGAEVSRVKRVVQVNMRRFVA